MTFRRDWRWSRRRQMWIGPRMTSRAIERRAVRDNPGVIAILRAAAKLRRKQPKGSSHMGRLMPFECEHGAIVDWGGFGAEDGRSRPEACAACDGARDSLSPSFTFDPEAHAIYVRLAVGEVTDTVEGRAEDGNGGGFAVMVDLDATGRPVGVEVLA